MTRDEFTYKAADICGYPDYYGGPFDPLVRDCDAMVLWVAVCKRALFKSQLEERHTQQPSKRHQAVLWARITSDSRIVGVGPTRAIAICRCVSAFLGWGEVPE